MKYNAFVLFYNSEQRWTDGQVYFLYYDVLMAPIMWSTQVQSQVVGLS